MMSMQETWSAITIEVDYEVFWKAISVLIAINVVFSGQVYANSLGVTYGSGFGSHAFSLTGDYEVGILEVEGTATLSKKLPCQGRASS